MIEYIFKGKKLDNNEWAYGYYIGDYLKPGVHVIADLATAELVRVDPETVELLTDHITCLTCANYDEGCCEIAEPLSRQSFRYDPETFYCSFWKKQK